MKKLLLSLSFLLLTLPSFAFAGGQYGVYVAPKVMFGVAHSNVSIYATEAGIPEYEYGRGESFNKATFGGALAIGYDFYTRFNIPLRAELEYGFFGNIKQNYEYVESYPSVATTVYEQYTGKLSLQSLMVNMYFDWHNSSNFTPYVTAGLGVGFVGLKVNGNMGANDLGISDVFAYTDLSSKRNTNFAWSLGLGCAYDFNDNISLDAGYRYAQFGKAQSQSEDLFALGIASARAKTKTISMHQFMVGVRFTF